MREETPTAETKSHSSLYWLTNSVLRYGMVHLLSDKTPLYIVNEYPRSGGTWVGQMLGAALGVPFPRNRLPVWGPCIMHGHYLDPWGMKNVVTVWRDGRDVMTSLYYKCLFENERGDPRALEAFRRDLPFEDYGNVRENLPAFLEYSFTRQRSPRFSWVDFIRRWYGRNGVIQVRYEDVRRDTAGELQRLFLELTRSPLDRSRAEEITEQFSFARQSGRLPGQEDTRSTMRKGVVGDWRNCFGREAREIFDHFAGEELIRLGYEPDRAWVTAEGGGLRAESAAST